VTGLSAGRELLRSGSIFVAGGGGELMSARKLRPIRGFVAGIGIAVGLCSFAAPQTNQNVVLPNPTPRDPDLYDKYHRMDPNDKAQQQALAQMRSAQVRLQVTSAASRLAQLAQQLKEDMERHEVGGPLGADVQKAAEIEKLAKTVKNSMKLQ